MLPRIPGHTEGFKGEPYLRRDRGSDSRGAAGQRPPAPALVVEQRTSRPGQVVAHHRLAREHRRPGGANGGVRSLLRTSALTAQLLTAPGRRSTPCTVRYANSVPHRTIDTACHRITLRRRAPNETSAVAVI